MGYSEKKEGSLEDTELENSIDSTLEDSDKAKTTKSVNSKVNPKAKEKTSFFKGVQSEFKKIIWPSQEDLGKQSVAVVVMSVLLGLLIAVVDLIVRFGLERIV